MLFLHPTGPSLFVDYWLNITKVCTEVNISILKQNKVTLWDLGEELSGNEILTIGKCKFTIMQYGKISYTNKDSFLSPECLSYWSSRTKFDSCSSQLRQKSVNF